MNGNYDDPPNYKMTTQQPVMQQPQQGGQTTVIIQQNVIQDDRPRMWSSGLCSCCDDMSSCCCGMFFPTCYLCYIASQYDENCCLPILVPTPLLALRVQHRNRHKIMGGIAEDWFSICCCPHCVLCQLKRDMDYVIQKKGSLSM